MYVGIIYSRPKGVLQKKSLNSIYAVLRREVEERLFTRGLKNIDHIVFHSLFGAVCGGERNDGTGKKFMDSSCCCGIEEGRGGYACHKGVAGD